MANIFKKAKSVQRANPRLTWQQAIKKAAKENRTGTTRKSVGASKRKRAVPKKKTAAVKTVSVRSAVQERMKKALWDYERATTISATKEAKKRILELRKQLKSL